MKQRFVFIIGIVLSVLFLWLALRGTSGAQIWRAFEQARAWMVLPFLLLLFAYYWIKAWRWSFLLAPMQRVPVRTAFTPIMIGYAASMVLPLQLGELVRTYIASRRFKIPGTPLLSSIFLERVLDFLALLVLVALALAIGADVPAALVAAGWVIGAGVLVAAVLAIGYVVWTPAVMAALRTLVRFLPSKWRERLLAQASLGAHGLHALRSRVLLAKIFALSLIQWAFMWGCIYLSLMALRIDTPLSAAFVTLIFTVIGVTLPTSPGYIGSIQFAYALALRPYGVSAEAAFAASVFFHALANISVITVGLYQAQRLGYTLRELQREAAHANPNG